ncbi:hypothetical protein GCM10028827_15180 [Mucilaginibacter myungsuensis]
MDYYQNQRYLEAADYLKKTFPEPITDVKALNRLAYMSRLAKRLPEAEMYYQRVYDIDTADRSALFAIADINAARGNQNRAELFLKRILLTDTTNISVYTKLATIAGSKKDTAAAVNYLERANKLNDADVSVAVDLGEFYIKLKKFDKALKVLDRASEVDPDNVYILQAMVELLFKEKKFKEVVASCQKLIALDAMDKTTRYRLGVSYYSLDNFSCGAEILSSTPTNDQTEYSDYFAALCYKGLKDMNKCIYWLGKAIEQGVSGNVASYYAEMGDSHEALAKPKNATKAYLKALQFDDTQPQYYYAIALVYDKQLKDKANAKLYYKKAAAAYVQDIKTVENPMTIYTLASLFDSQLKDTANAIKYYKKYISSKPPQKQQQYIDYTNSRIGQLGGGTD